VLPLPRPVGGGHLVTCVRTLYDAAMSERARVAMPEWIAARRRGRQRGEPRPPHREL